MDWPRFDPATFGNMFIQTLLSIVVGFAAGWYGHRTAAQRDSRNHKYQELQYWRKKFDEHVEESQKIERLLLAQDYIYTDIPDSAIKNMVPADRWLLKQAREAKKKVEELELGIKN